MVHRGETLGESVKYWVRPDIENRIKEGRGRRAVLDRGAGDPPDARRRAARGRARRGHDSGGGRVAAHRLSRRSRVPAAGGVELRSRDANMPRHDADTFETNVPNLFIAGGQIAGRRTGTMFIENGRFHGEQVAKALAERLG